MCVFVCVYTSGCVRERKNKEREREREREREKVLNLIKFETCFSALAWHDLTWMSDLKLNNSIVVFAVVAVVVKTTWKSLKFVFFSFSERFWLLLSLKSVKYNLRMTLKVQNKLITTKYGYFLMYTNCYSHISMLEYWNDTQDIQILTYTRIKLT